MNIIKFCTLIKKKNNINILTCPNICIKNKDQSSDQIFRTLCENCWYVRLKVCSHLPLFCQFLQAKSRHFNRNFSWGQKICPCRFHSGSSWSYRLCWLTGTNCLKVTSVWALSSYIATQLTIDNTFKFSPKYF